ncbi:MAG: hypothetical protein F9K40_14070 [Kofleriaceae bacterium]|nr:MAG: hypothetical protein F9K40_14070 [Kofleriaceae bacterium]MBZ0233418.1 hypothetical protein [Kofleriaceae bacterium]
MLRTLAALLLVLLAACEGTADKAKEIGKKIDNAADKLDRSEADTYLAQAKDAVLKNQEPSEACSWLTSSSAQNAAASAQASIDELRVVCTKTVPLMRAANAVNAAEAARREQPQAPTLTECASDAWAKEKVVLERDFPTEPLWIDLRARWAKVCPDAP